MEAPVGQSVLSTHTGLNLFLQRHMVYIYLILRWDKWLSKNKKQTKKTHKNGEEDVMKKHHSKRKSNESELIGFNSSTTGLKYRLRHILLKAAQW